VTLVTPRDQTSPTVVRSGTRRPARRLALPAAVGAVVVLGVLLRLHSASALWLDESLSVNIARLPLQDMPGALRRDGSPPLYYLLLHGWISLFGTDGTAVRALSTVFALAALPLAWLVGRRLRDPATGWVALLLLASSPFLVRYATETRMYALVVALVLLGALALHAAWQRPTAWRLAGVSVVCGLLMLTHYWSLYLLTVTGLVLLVASVRGGHRRAARRCVVALAAGGLLFLPWLPSFLYQARHTGTPWARTPGPGAVSATLNAWAGGSALWAAALVWLLVALVVLALVGRRQPGGVLLGPPVDRTAAVLTVIGLGTVLLGVALAAVSAAGYSSRYSSAAVVPFLVAAALGAGALPARARTVVVGLAVACGLAGSVPLTFSSGRTQAPMIASALRAGLQPGDVVVYCPDQLGPAVSRLLPLATDQVVYPTMGRPELVDWVDYAQRNREASPTAFTADVLARTDGTVWLVSAAGYLTFGHQCETLDAALRTARDGRELVVPARRSYAERMQLTRYP
jgi:hypothetical protein